MGGSAAARVSERLAPFGTTIFTTMTRLAQEHGAVNLAQGFPDFDGPGEVREAACRALREQHNQYAPMPGLPALRAAIASRWERTAGFAVDPEREVTVTSGCTEAIAAAMLGLVNPGDEVVLFEPFYDSYLACVRMAGAVPRVVPLRPPAGTGAGIVTGAFTFDERALRAAFGPRTRAVLLNTPHNPTGKVFSADELRLVAELCEATGAIAVTDEVYERLVFEPGTRPHVHLASLPGMRERTVSLSSLGKTFSLTGWKIGWAVAPPELTAGIRAAHQFLTFATATPLQHGAVAALAAESAYVPGLVDDYRARLDELAPALAQAGMRVYRPEGTYFVMADHGALGYADDVAFCRHLTEHVRVAAIPPGAFYTDPARARTLARFAFCKRRETIGEAIRRLGALRPAGGGA